MHCLSKHITSEALQDTVVDNLLAQDCKGHTDSVAWIYFVSEELHFTSDTLQSNDKTQGSWVAGCW